MAWYDFIWTTKFLAKIDERGITVDEVRELLLDADFIESSDSTGLPLVRGYVSTGRYLVVVFVFEDDITVRPITAFTPDKDF
ncbi:MAG: DUF4258 domain-containing protein [Planctomycetaceae bacterium]|nr:DUF4258 domain-containing protein [Planctomycetaceae bacterium]